MGTKHTEGPWEAREVPHFNNIIIAQTGMSDGIATVHPLTGQRTYQLSDLDRANARLIAAAPDLLDALKVLVSADDRQKAHTPEQMDAARAAIAKAEG